MYPLHYERGEYEYLLSEMKQYIAGLLFSQIQRIGLVVEGEAERWNRVALRRCERFQHLLLSPASRISCRTELHLSTRHHVMCC